MAYCKKSLIAMVMLLEAVPTGSVSALAAMRQESEGKNATANPFNSKVIEGPDCGRTKQIFAKWQKAKKVGRLAGKASGSITVAKTAADVLDNAADRAVSIGKSVSEDGSTLPTGLDAAVKKANTASTDAATAAQDLETELAAFKTAMKADEFSGAGIDEAKMVKLKELTEAAQKASKTAQEEVEVLLKKAESEREEALKSSDTVVRMVKKVLDQGTPLLEQSSEIGRKAGYAVDSAKKSVTKGDEAVKKFDVANAEEQAPVVQTAKDLFEKKQKAVTDAQAPVTTAIADLKTATDDLKTKLEPLTTASREAAGGGVVSGVSKDIQDGEEAIHKVDMAMEEVKGKTRVLVMNQKKLDAAIEEVEKKEAKKSA